MVMYICDEAKRTVVAMYEDDDESVVDSLIGMLTKLGVEDELITWLIAKYEGQYKIRGIAKCYEDDKWDLHTGQELARKRLNNKFNALKNMILSDCSKRLYSNFITTIKRVYAKRNNLKVSDIGVAICVGEDVESLMAEWNRGV